MSRAYRICLRESAQKLVCAEDHVSLVLEMLSILPEEQMAELLDAELRGRGFEKQGEVLQRNQAGLSISVDPRTANVIVSATAADAVELKAEVTGYATDEQGSSAKRVEAALRRELAASVKQKAALHRANLEAKVTAAIEAKLDEIGLELNSVVNRVTAEALKRKAAMLGTIKHISEDSQSGSMTIVLEV
jgi:hypothetical protein